MPQEILPLTEDEITELVAQLRKARALEFNDELYSQEPEEWNPIWWIVGAAVLMAGAALLVWVAAQRGWIL